jgi:hypothetical protein
MLLILQEVSQATQNSIHEVLREWVAFLFLVIGGSIAIRTYVVNQRQRRLENSFRLLTLFKESIGENDIDAWADIFYKSAEPTGVRSGYFLDEGQERPLSDLFSPGSPDGGATQRMAEQFDLISQEILAKTVNLRLIYFNLGQLMDFTHQWLKTVENFGSDKTFLEEAYPHFDKLYKKKGKQFKKWSYKTYAQIC